MLSLCLYTQSLHHLRQVDEVHELDRLVSAELAVRGVCVCVCVCVCICVCVVLGNRELFVEFGNFLYKMLRAVIL